MWMTLVAALIAIAGVGPSSLSKPPTSMRFRCDATAPKLMVSVDDLELTLDVSGARFSEQPLLIDDARLTVDAAVAGERGTILALRKPEPGLYRATLLRKEPALLVAADVWSLCMTGDGDAWAIVARAGTVRFVLVSSASPVVRFFDLGETVVQALRASPEVSVAQARRAYRWLAGQGWPEVEQAGELLLKSARPELRAVVAEALAQRDDAAARAGLWLLAHDPVLAVRREAFAKVRERCGLAREAACVELIVMFIDDPNQEQAWMARDALLIRKPEVALRDAPSAYKLDAVALLMKERERLGFDAVRKAAELLVTDADAAVRRAARVLVDQFE